MIEVGMTILKHIQNILSIIRIMLVYHTKGGKMDASNGLLPASLNKVLHGLIGGTKNASNMTYLSKKDVMLL